MTPERPPKIRQRRMKKSEKVLQKLREISEKIGPG
jgi:hypothetical protein